MLLGDLGVYMPAFFALLARRHIVDYGTKLEHLAKISVKNHKYGALNPNSQYQREVTIEEVRNSISVGEPLTILDCCPIGDGAAAVVICSDDLTGKYSKKPVKVLSSAFATARYRGSGASVTVSDVTRVAAEKAYKEAGITPNDVDVIECHDCFSITEIMIYDGLYLCEVGQGGGLIDDGITEIDGKWPTNLSGGLLSKGHPIGATGVGQIAEIVWQLRGDACRRQVPNRRKIGLAHNYGGFAASTMSDCQVGGGDFANCVVTVMGM
jgi:acetyl-CoA C-acetyltransferase